MAYPLPSHSNEEHPIVARWQVESARRDTFQQQLLLLAAISDLDRFEVRLTRSVDGFDVVVHQQPQG